MTINLSKFHNNVATCSKSFSLKRGRHDVELPKRLRSQLTLTIFVTQVGTKLSGTRMVIWADCWTIYRLLPNFSTFADCSRQSWPELPTIDPYWSYTRLIRESPLNPNIWVFAINLQPIGFLILGTTLGFHGFFCTIWLRSFPPQMVHFSCFHRAFNTVLLHLTLPVGGHIRFWHATCVLRRGEWRNKSCVAKSNVIKGTGWSPIRSHLTKSGYSCE